MNRDGRPGDAAARTIRFLFAVGSIAAALFALYIAADVRKPWYNSESTAAVLTMTFLPSVLIAVLAVVWASAVLPVLARRMPERPDIVSAILAEADPKQAAEKEGHGTKRGLGGVFLLGVAVAAASLTGLSGAPWAPTAWFALNNGVVVFSLLETVVLLALGLPQLYFASSPAAGKPTAHAAPSADDETSSGMG